MALSAFPPSRKIFGAIRENFSSSVEAKKVVAFALGGALLGSGMTICGSVRCY